MRILMIAISIVMLLATQAFCEIKYIEPYIRSDGTCVSGHYRDTSNDGVPYNNANYLGINGHRESKYIF
jgi:hypothetical protein